MNAESNGRRLHLLTALVLLAVFAAGAAAGAGITWALRPPPGHPPGPRPGAPRPGGLPPPYAALGLSPEQEKGVRAVLEAHRPDLEKAIEEAFPRVRAVQEATELEVRALLTPEQAARLDELQARRAQRGGPRGGPVPGLLPHGPGAPPPDGAPPGPPPHDGPRPGGPGGHPRPAPPR